MAGRSVCELFVRPQPMTFGSDALSELQTLLTELENGTTIQTISSPQELQLDENARTRVGGFRYTRHAFLALSRQLGTGLAAALPDLAGAAGRDVREDEIDGHLARTLFNNVTELRFKRVSGIRLVRDERSKVIDGVFGTPWRRLSNRLLLQRCVELWAPSRLSSARFHGAALLGRQLRLWFRHRHAVATFQTETERWPIYAGYYVSNSESVGSAVRAMLTLFTKRGTCLAPPGAFGGRLSHNGRDFARRFDALLQQLSRKEIPSDKIKAGFHRLAALNLGLGGDSEAERAASAKTLSNQLVRLGLSVRFADDIVDRVKYLGSEMRLEFEQGVDWARAFAKRTGLDLFSVVVATARGLDINRREQLERAAFKLLLEGVD